MGPRREIVNIFSTFMKPVGDVKLSRMYTVKFKFVMYDALCRKHVSMTTNRFLLLHSQTIECAFAFCMLTKIDFE